MSWGCRECFFLQFLVVLSVFSFNFWMSWLFFFLQFLYIAMFLKFTFHFLAISFLDTLYNSNSRFYLADKAVGAKGFKAIWTEIKVNIVLWEKMSKICTPTLFRTRRLVKMLHMNLSARTHLIASPGKGWWFPSKCCNLDFFLVDRIWVIRKMDSNNLTWILIKLLFQKTCMQPRPELREGRSLWRDGM